MREFVIKRLRRAPIIEPLWDQFERMLAARDAALIERDVLQKIDEDAFVENFFTRDLERFVKDEAFHFGDNAAEWYFEPAEETMDVQWEYVQLFLGNHPIDYTNTIELSCGRGRNSERLSTLSKNLVLVDVVPENILFCKTRFPDKSWRFVINNGFDLREISSKSITFVYCFEAAVHFDLEIILSYIKEFRRVMTLGAFGFVHHSNVTANPGKDYRTIPHGRNFMSKEIFTHLCVHNGLEIVDQHVFDQGGPEADCFSLFRKNGAMQCHDRVHTVTQLSDGPREEALHRQSFAHTSVPRLAANGANIPLIGLGTLFLPDAECARATETALSLGYRHIDTAVMYGNEVGVGNAIRSSGIPRGELFITTKVMPEEIGEGDLQRSAVGSLQRLGLDYVDLLLLHWPNPAIPLSISVKALCDAKKLALTRHIGVSNFPTKLLEAAAVLAADQGERLVANQCEYHPRLNQTKVLEACRANGIAFVSHTPLGHGRLLDDPTLVTIARRVGKTPAQVLLRWNIQQPGIVAIPKSAQPARLAENLQVVDFELSDEDMSVLFGMASADGRMVYPVNTPVPEWD
jgi:diketogulonate reductase-like aldo/keto reductase